MQDQWPGSKWWKVDFHTHSPASTDYKGEKDVLPKEWLEQYHNAGVQCVVVTDHNTAAWIDGLRLGLNELKTENFEKWNGFEIFPGVELSCNGGVHLIAILDPSKQAADIEGIIGAVGYQGDRGDSNGVTTSSIEDVIKNIHEKGGVVCAAHIDMPKGLLNSVTDFYTLQQLIPKLDALEVIYPQSDIIKNNQETIDGFASVLGSDSHKPLDVGKGYTWVKMSVPTIEGLRLALLDPASSIIRSDQQSDNPQTIPEQWIESIEMQKMHLARVNPVSVSFHPSYNALIGGRGSGKSTVVESLRLSLARDNEISSLPGSEITRTFDDFKKTNSAISKLGMMLDDSELQVIVNKGMGQINERYKYSWKNSPNNEDGVLSVHRWDENEWHATDFNSDQARERFPVKIFSQKQILALANSPQALLEYIDGSISEEKLAWQNDFDIKKQKLLAVRMALQSQRKELLKKPALVNDYREARKKARVFSNDTFGELLRSYRRATSQKEELDSFYEVIGDDIQVLRSSCDQIENFSSADLDAFITDSDNEKTIKKNSLSVVSSLNSKYQKIVKDIEAMTAELEVAQKSVLDSEWQKENNAHILAYTAETEKLKAAGMNSAEEASEAVATEVRLSAELAKLRKIEEQLPEAEEAVNTAEQELLLCREQLTTIRQIFIAELFNQNDMLKVNLRSMADCYGSVGHFREILRLPITAQFADIFQEGDHETPAGGLLWDMVDPAYPVSSVGERLVEIKQALEEGSKEILNTTLHGALHKKLKANPIEAFNELSHWFPEDEVQLEYRPAKGQSYKSIAQASAGQKTAAILSFLLIHGNEPLILDQPEDDLDNALVSDLVVEQLRANKKHRQLIIVTHNANVVVNADAELVTTMDFNGGQIVCNNSGGLQERKTREDICRIMEGGRVAFQQRYKRILKDLEPAHGGAT